MSARAESSVLWTGRPDFRSVAGRIWRVRIVALYFAALLIDGAVMIELSPEGRTGFGGEAKLLVMGLMTLAILALLAWLTHRTTRYEITDTDIVMRFGLALPRKLVIPYGAVAEVKLRVNGDGKGDLALRLREGQGVMYMKLWPHVRAWSFTRPEPMLRSLDEPGVVGAMLCRAMAAHASRVEAERSLAGVARRGPVAPREARSASGGSL